MDNQQEKQKTEVGKGDRQATRTKDNPIGIDDIGLPSGIQKDEVSRLEELKPDPEKTQQPRP
jgi:hypothetical protein